MNSEEYITISSIRSFIICKRQWMLENIDKDFDNDNYYLTIGSIYHESTDQQLRVEKKKDKCIVHASPLISEKLNIGGRADILELIYDKEGVLIKNLSNKQARIVPVELKVGRQGESFYADTIQLMCQILCLEEMYNTQIDYGYIYYKQSNKKVLVESTDALREDAIDTIKELQKALKHIDKISFTESDTSKYCCKKCKHYHLCKITNNKKSETNYFKRVEESE